MPSRAPMLQTILTVDLGNTRAKLRAWRGAPTTGELEAAVDFPCSPTLSEELASWLASCGPFDVALVCAVCRPAVEAEVIALLRSRVREVIHDLDSRLLLQVDDPAGVGRDRVFAARGALEVAGASCLVVDAGTALTVDAVRAASAGESSAGTFLGGAIAPGPALLARALSEGGARLPRVEAPLEACALGKDTSAAIAAGVVVGFQGAVAGLVAAVGRESGLEDCPVVLTGGEVRRLQLALADSGDRTERADDLVHRGLLAAFASYRGCGSACRA